MRHRFLPAALTLALLLLASASCRREAPAPDPVAAFEERFGVEVLGLHRTAAGMMLSFRYRVLDPDRAARLVDRKVKPELDDRARGRRLVVPRPPRVGPLRQTVEGAPEPGRTYFMLFTDPGKAVRPGDRLDLVLGDARLEGLEVL